MEKEYTYDDIINLMFLESHEFLDWFNSLDIENKTAYKSAVNEYFPTDKLGR
jgi:hypothetical protein